MKLDTSRSIQNLKKAKGFTLVEVMIVVVIIGIIAAVGFPSYTDYVRKSRRADGHLALLSAVQSMERCKTTRFSYANCTIPPNEMTSPEGYYLITMGPGLSAATFQLVAAADNAQLGDGDCLELTIDELGERLPADCW